MPFLPALAGAIGTAFAGTAFGAAATATATWLGGNSLLAGIVKAGLAIAAQYAVGKIFGSDLPGTATQLETTYGETAPRMVILGKCGVSGQHVYRNTNGSGNRRVLDVHRLADFRITAVDRVRNLGEWTTLGADNGTRGKAVVNSEADFYIKVYDGTQTTADVNLVADANPAGRWTNNHKGIGVPYIIADQSLNAERKMTSPWEPFVEVRGAPLYDWRKDSTVGGSGSHRWDDQDTWEFSENPVIQMYNLERGIYIGSELIIGKGVPASRLPLAEWTIAANICDELVSGTKRYRSSLIARAGEQATHDDNLQPLLEACAGSWVEDATGEFPIVGATQAVVATFTDDDLAPGESFRFSAKRPRSELVNTVSGTYIDPDSFYEPKAFAVRIDAAALAEDAERLAVSIPYTAVIYPECSDRLSDIAIRSSRYQANGEICLKPKFLRIKPGRWVEWQSQKYGTRKFLVLTKRLGEIGSKKVRNVYLTLQEVANGVFDPTAYVTVPTDPAPPGAPDFQSEPDNFVGIGVYIENPDGTKRPGLRFTWDPFTDVTVIRVDVQYRPTGETEAITTGSNVPINLIRTTDGVLAETLYEERHRIITSPPRTTFWTDWADLQTPTPEAVIEGDFGLDQWKSDAYDRIVGMQQELNEYRGLLEQLAMAGAQAAGIQVRTETIVQAFKGATAGVIQSISTSIQELEIGVVAAAEALTALQATVGENSGAILWRMNVEADPGNAFARVVLQLRATMGDEWVTVGTLWEAGFEGGDRSKPYGLVQINADQFRVTNGAGTSLPFVVQDGVLYVAEAMIRSANIGVLEVKTSNLDFNAVTEKFSQRALLEIPQPVSVGVANPTPAFSFLANSPLLTLLSSAGILAATSTGGAGSYSMAIRIVNVSAGKFLYTGVFTATSGANFQEVVDTFVMDNEPVDGENLYRLDVLTFISSTRTATWSFDDYNDAPMFQAVWWKR